jgi:hypothetical protein
VAPGWGPPFEHRERWGTLRRKSCDPIKSKFEEMWATRLLPGAPSLRFLQGWDSTDAAYRAFSATIWTMERPTLSHRTRKDGAPSG